MKKKTNLLLLLTLVLSLFVSCDLINAKENNNNNSSPTPQTITIVGRIVNSETGKGISNASVTDTSYSATMSNVSTDIDGYFQLDFYNKYVNSVTLEISASGFITSTETIYLSGYNFHNCKDIKINPERIYTTVYGYVRDSSNNAIPNAKVDITGENGIVTVTTDSSGYYTHNTTHFGSFAIQVSSQPITSGGVTKFYQPTNTIINTDSNSYSKDFSLISNTI